MKVNYHTHTEKCGHGIGTEIDYVKAAIDQGISILGFSDHGPFPDKEYPFRMPYSLFDSYINTIDLLKEQYGSEITIKKAVEIEFLPQYISFYEEMLTKMKFDYLLLGQHFYIDYDGDFVLTGNSKATKGFVYYANAIAKALDTGLFKIVAHPDYFMTCKFPWDGYCEEAFDIIIDAAKRNNCILEYNANGLRQGIKSFPDGPRYPYPVKRFWDKVAQVGTVRTIIGSDTHEPDLLFDDAMVLAYEMIKKHNIDPIFTFN